MRHRLALFLVVAVLLAGCAGGDAPEQTATATTEHPPTTDATTDPPRSGTTDSTPTAETTSRSRSTTATTTTTPSDREIVVTGGSVPVDPNRQFERVENLTGYEATPPERIEITDPDELRNFERRQSTLESYLGFPEVEFTVSAYAWDDRIVVNSSIGVTSTEVTLAHELHHVLFYQRNVSLYGNSHDRTSKEQFLARTITEGSADYVQHHYWQEYVKPEGENPTAEMQSVYRNGTPTKRAMRAPYYFGERYMDYRVDSPRNLTTVYEDPPQTAEELIHLLPPGSEPPTPLSVEKASGPDWQHLLDRSPDTRGELFVRHALQVGVDDETAARGADGWGNDSLLTFEHVESQQKGYVWTLRFDDAANASEFETVFSEYLSNRSEQRGSVWIAETSAGSTVAFRTRTVDPETVAVVFGPREFAENVTVTGDDGRVVVETP
jgi:hypothetical protein